MEVKQKVCGKACKIEIDSDLNDALLDTIKSEIKEEPKRETTHDIFDYVDLKTIPIKSEIGQDELESLEERKISEKDPQVAFNFNNRNIFNVNIKEVAKIYPNLINATQLSVEWQHLPNTFNEIEVLEFINMSIEEMWLKIIENFNDEGLFPNLKYIINFVLSLPHSNAEAQKIFSMVKTQNKKNVAT
ncbi:unnamed protein product [Diabrotica balteata]|uniref:HAT C-terminal dimerisation domain-containing protein n=1 Tax=Diabrotica balteata TaxID=107213 RepID=A0A9N9T2F3_DIABA|nr:unnamed protein product [Diabrotica balteata]